MEDQEVGRKKYQSMELVAFWVSLHLGIFWHPGGHIIDRAFLGVIGISRGTYLCVTPMAVLTRLPRLEREKDNQGNSIHLLVGRSRCERWRRPGIVSGIENHKKLRGK